MASSGPRGPQRRGELRRARLLDAAAELLASQVLAEVSLERVARRAGIPVASSYHFYPDRLALFGALARRYGEQVAALLARPLPARRVRRWEDLLELNIRRVAAFYRRHPAAQRLLIDPRAPPEIKLADRAHDRSLGALVAALFDRHFVLPRFRGRQQVFFHAVEIVDLMLLLSVMQSGRITAAMQRHAAIACCAYLREFLGARLEPRPARSPAHDTEQMNRLAVKQRAAVPSAGSRRTADALLDHRRAAAAGRPRPVGRRRLAQLRQ